MPQPGVRKKHAGHYPNAATRQEQDNMSDSSSSSSGGIGFVGLLTVAFIVLKLTGVIGWSWWWVLSPLWIGLCLVLLIIGVALGIYAVIESRKS